METKEYWVDNILIDENYKISSIRLKEVSEITHDNGMVYSEHKDITLSKDELLKIHKSINIKNLVELTENSITLKRGTYDELELINEPNSDTWGYNIVAHSKICVYDNELDVDSHKKKLANYLAKSKTLGIMNQMSIDEENDITYKAVITDNKLKLPPTEIVDIKILDRLVEEIICSDDNVSVKIYITADKSKYIKRIILGKHTQHINILYFCNMNLDLLDLGGSHYLPSLIHNAKIKRLVVSTLCELHKTAYERLRQVEELEIKEIN